jgi:hypothetical protein
MKNVFLIFGILALTFSSCTDFIEEDNKSSVTAESFYITAVGFKSLVNANYSQLKVMYGGAPWLFCAGTDLYAQGRGAEPAGLSQYNQLNPSSAGVEQIYNDGYAAIQLANRALYYSELTEKTSDLNALIGEVKFLRANAYFLMVQTYGGVSIVTDYISSPVLSFTRNTAEEVYTQIINDLKDAETKVNDAAYTGRVNKRAVKDLLARVYLTRGYEAFGSAADFTAAAALADEVIAGQALTLSFEELWTPGKDLNKEVVFSVQIDKNSVNHSSTDPTQLGSQQFYYFSSYLGGAEVAGRMPNRSYNLCPTGFALGLYTKEDTRWKATFMTEIYESYYDYFRVADKSTLKVRDFYEPQWFTAADKTAYLATAKLATTFKYHSWNEYSAESTQVSALDYKTIPVKKFDDPATTTPFGTGRVSTRDIILSRLGETYLIASEAYLKANNTALSLARLNEVRRRAGVPAATTVQLNIDYILDERARELLGEYHRWFDLKRTGKLVERASKYHYLIKADNFKGVGGVLKILRPIPQAALDLNQNKDFPQNPGY